MKISVAIATYNGEKFIEKQLNSIFMQNLSVDEVIISDDCSTDETVNICKKFIKNNRLENWFVFENDTNVGYCLNFYNAINLCAGDIIFLSDQDDEWYQNKTEIMLNCLKDNSEITVLSSRYDVIDEKSNIINLKLPYLGEKFDNSVETYCVNDFIGCSCVRGFSLCFKKELVQHIKPINLNCLLSHDWLISILGCIFGKTAVLNTKLCGYRCHKNNVSLSYINRKTLIGNLEKRIKGLYQSVNGHKYILECLKEGRERQKISDFIAFETLRIKFLECKNIFIWIKLFFNLKHYRRYYKDNGIRVFFGDFAYAFNLNFKKFKSNKKNT